MKFDLEKASGREVIRHIVSELYSDSPSAFKNTAIFDEDGLIYQNNSLVFTNAGILNKLKHIAKDFFENDKSTNAVSSQFIAKMIEGDVEISSMPYSAIYCRTQKDLYDNQISNKEIAFVALHELAHTHYYNNGKKNNSPHREEIYADTEAYFLYPRLFANNINFLRGRIYDTSMSSFQKCYNECGAHYTTNALLAAVNVAQQINLELLSINQIAELSSIISEEFYLPISRRKQIYKEITEGKESSLLLNAFTNAVKTRNTDSLRAGWQISLSDYLNGPTYFKKNSNSFKTTKAARSVIRKCSKILDVGLEPLNEKVLMGIPSPTQRWVNREISANPKLKKHPISSTIEKAKFYSFK